MDQHGCDAGPTRSGDPQWPASALSQFAATPRTLDSNGSANGDGHTDKERSAQEALASFRGHLEAGDVPVPRLPVERPRSGPPLAAFSSAAPRSPPHVRSPESEATSLTGICFRRSRGEDDYLQHAPDFTRQLDVHRDEQLTSLADRVLTLETTQRSEEERWAREKARQRSSDCAVAGVLKKVARLEAKLAEAKFDSAVNSAESGEERVPRRERSSRRQKGEPQSAREMPAISARGSSKAGLWSYLSDTSRTKGPPETSEQPPLEYWVRLAKLESEFSEFRSSLSTLGSDLERLAMQVQATGASAVHVEASVGEASAVTMQAEDIEPRVAELEAQVAASARQSAELEGLLDLARQHFDTSSGVVTEVSDTSAVLPLVVEVGGEAPQPTSKRRGCCARRG